MMFNGNNNVLKGQHILAQGNALGLEIGEKIALKNELLEQFSKEELFFKFVPHYLGDLMTKYFRIAAIGGSLANERPALALVSEFPWP